MPNDILQFISASSISLESFTQLFNRSFENYFYSMNLSPSTFAARLRLESLDLHHSVVLIVNDTLAGQATLGLRGDTAWCGGFGIIPDYRGQGLASKLFAEFLNKAKETRARRLLLEVLIKNTTAQRVYTKAGLKHQHDLLLFEWKSEKPLMTENTSSDLKIQVAYMPEIIEHFYRFHPVAVAWQRDLPTLISQPNLLQISLKHQGQLQGYVLFSEKDKTARIWDVGALEPSILKSLLKYLQTCYQEISSINEPEPGPLGVAFLECGFREFDRQYQMQMDL